MMCPAEFLVEVNVVRECPGLIRNHASNGEPTTDVKDDKNHIGHPC